MRLIKFIYNNCFILLIFISLNKILITHTHAKTPAGVSGTLSIVPGLGQVANGDTLEGFAWLGLVGGAFLIDRTWGADLIYYNMYDAYRDAKPTIKRYSDYNLFQNYIAFYNPLNIADAIGAPVVAAGAYAGKGHYNFTLGNIAHYSTVGLGEEALFRGFLFPAFSDVFYSKFLGALVSSTIFAAAHWQYKALNQKLMVGILGMVMCWQVDRNKYDLRKSMFAHSWYDIMLSGKSASLSDHKNENKITGVTLNWNSSF